MAAKTLTTKIGFRRGWGGKMILQVELKVRDSLGDLCYKLVDAEEDDFSYLNARGKIKFIREAADG